MSPKDKIIQKKARIAVIGLGYVGLPLAVEIGKAGFEVTGIDIDEDRVKKVNQSKSYIVDISEKQLKSLVEKKKLRATSEFSILETADVILICVPTPITKWKEPDISYIISAAKEIKKHLKRDQLVVLESTTYPGTTQEVVLPILAESGLEVGKDFFLAYSPERIDPGNKRYTIKNTPKLVGGVTQKCGELTKTFYEQFVDNVILVSSSTIAEMSKIYENIFRCVNIALVNELALLCDRMGLNVWEVIEAASTKPYGFMPFYPGPGLGGHCIPVDPYYLSWKAREYDFHVKFIELAASINDNMPYYVCNKTIQALNSRGKSIKKAKILVLGVTYKKDVADIRESPALKIMSILENQGAQVFYNDPYVPELKITNPKGIQSTPLSDKFLKSMDCVVIVANHSCYDYGQIAENASLVVDTRNALNHFHQNHNVISL